MAETTTPPAWVFDPMNPGAIAAAGPGCGFEPGVASDEDLWYRTQFGMNGFDMAPGQWQPDLNQAYELPSPMAAGKTPYQPVLYPIQTGFPGRSEKMLPGYEAESQPHSLDDLLRTASQLATERALYMNIPPSATTSDSAHPLSPGEPGITSPGASPSHHSSASEDEHGLPFEIPQVYRLPDPSSANPFIPTTTAHATASTKMRQDLTPLEMPDGTTRLTANWLPVDPEGGFTIRPPSHNHQLGIDPELTDYQGHFHFHLDGHNEYNCRNAFISLDNLGNESGV
ncbi:hypothetical protein BDV18DRAFT_61628 [Aspergillus unguis]